MTKQAVIALSTALCLSAAALAEDWIVLFESYTSGLSNTEALAKSQVAFLVRQGDLARDHQWAPSQQECPFNLGSASVEAKRALFTAKAVTNQMSLTRVRISRIHKMILWTNLTNHWLMTYTFIVDDFPTPNVYHYQLVTLLNGIIANERKNPLSETSTNSSIIDRGEQIANTVKSATNVVPSPWPKIQLGDFTIPAIQWDPSSGTFPMDLNRQSVRAKEHASRYCKGADLPQDLEEISLCHYVPFEVLKSRGLLYSENRFHWLVCFSFTIDPASRKTAEVYMQLDGTIL